MRILLVDDDDSIREYIIVTLENLFDEIDIVECVSGNQAKKLLGSDPYFNLIISDHEMEDGNGGELYQFCQEMELETPFILHTSCPMEKVEEIPFQENPVDTFYIKKGGDYLVFKNALLAIPTIKDSKYLKKKDEDYKRIRLFYFYRFSKTLCDIYLKLSDRKYIKVINSGEYLDMAIIDKYAKKQQDYLYIKSDDYVNFATTLAAQPFLVFDEDMPLEDKLSRTTAVIQNMAQSTGLSRSVINMAERHMKDIISIAENLDKLSELLNKMRSRLDYCYDHSYLLAYLSGILCTRLGWNTRRSKEKLCLAALFHDVVIKDPNLAIVTGLDDERLKNFSKEDQVLYANHPLEASELVYELANEYPNVDDIIAQHHERPDGTGFPKKLTFTKLQPLSCLFIVAHDFISEMYKVEFDKEKYPAILEDFKKKYDQGHFVKIVDQLAKLSL